MRRALRIAPIVLLALAAATYGQSLGDVARQARQKEKARAKAAKKVITNEDIPESPTQVRPSTTLMGRPTHLRLPLILPLRGLLWNGGT